MTNNLKLVIFDMDGTVFKSFLDWKKIKKELDVKEGKSILKTIYNGNNIDKKRLNILLKYENDNTKRAYPIEGIDDFLKFLKSNSINTAILTNNNKENTYYLLNKYSLNFDLVITRESGLWKPSGRGFEFIMKEFSCNTSNTSVIGDSYYDIKASRDAKISDIYIIKNQHIEEEEGVVYFKNYTELLPIFKIKYGLN